MANGGDFDERWKGLLLLGVLLGLFVLMRSLGLEKEIPRARAWIATFGFWAPALCALLYGLAVTAFVPGTLMTLSVAALFGPALGLAVVSVGGTLGATLSFLIARHLARERVTRWFSASPRFQWLREQTSMHAVPIVIVTRLLPVIPANLLHYAFGLTEVPVGVFVFWSWACMLPGTILYIVGVEALHHAVVQGETPWSLLGILLVTASVLGLLVLWARRQTKSVP